MRKVAAPQATPGAAAGQRVGVGGYDKDTTATLAQAATWYATRLAWPIVPLHWVDNAGRCSCGNPSCRSAGKHPILADWPRRATRDPATIAAWWQRWPLANVGVALGSGHVVLDVDPRHGGDEALADLEAAHEPLPPTPTVLTGGGGTHYHFVAPPDVPTVTLAPGLELKAAGAQVVLPPSRSAAGLYRWDAGAHIADLPLAPLPDWLLTLAHQARHRSGRLGELPAAVRQGERNVLLFRYAAAFRRYGLTEDELTAVLAVLNASRCQPPLDERELRGIARSAARYPAGDLPTGRNRRRSGRMPSIRIENGRVVAR